MPDRGGRKAAATQNERSLWWKLGWLATGFIAYGLGRELLGLGPSSYSYAEHAVGYGIMAIPVLIHHRHASRRSTSLHA